MLRTLLRSPLAGLVLVAATVTLLAVPVADAAKPSPPSSLEIPFAAAPASKQLSRARVEIDTGRRLDLFHVDFQAQPSTPEDMARQFLRAATDVLRLSDPEGSDLVVHAVRTGPSGTVVRFRQTVDGIPVYGPDLAVKIDLEDRVTYVANGYRPGLDLVRAAPEISADEALGAALRHLEPVGGLNFESTRLVVFPAGLGSRLAYQVDIEPRISPLGSWRVMVDAETGAVFGAENRAPHVDAPATVFDPDPLSSAGVQYGAPGYVDNNDADSPELTAQALARTLLDVTEVTPGADYALTGPWAECVDFELPLDGCYNQSSAAWNFTRNAQAFEQANVYYHIDTYMRYLNITLGLNIRPDLYPGGVQYDGLGFNGADNSHYLSASQRVSFGEGGVDDAEDADVVIHELGHGLHDWAAGAISQIEGLSEGIGDYAAAEYSRAFGQWGPGDPEHQWVFSWDGHNPFWPGRVTNWNDTRTYPADLVGQVHTDGQFWSSCNMDVWDAIGRTQSLTAHWEGIKMTNGGSNQNAAAQAVVQAAIDAAFPALDIAAIVSVFQGCGYSVSGPPIFADGFESGDTLAWSAAVP